jgi:hypothetical protein
MSNPAGSILPAVMFKALLETTYKVYFEGNWAGE